MSASAGSHRAPDGYFLNQRSPLLPTMKTLSTFAIAALLAAGFSAQAQSTTSAASPAAAKPETTAPAATTSAGSTVNDGAMIASAAPTMSAAAMRARSAGSHRPAARGAAPVANKTIGFKDGVTMRDGKVVATESGRSTFLTEPTMTIKLMTGLEAAGTGIVTRPDGTTETLQEGDYISLTGRLTSAQDNLSHAQSLKENLKEDRKVAAKKARSPLRQIQL